MHVQKSVVWLITHNWHTSQLWFQLLKLHKLCTSYRKRYNWRGQQKKGITVFDNLKRSKVIKEFLLPSKTTRLNFNSTQFQLLNFSLEDLFNDENALLTFDLLGSSKTVIPFFHWALQLYTDTDKPLAVHGWKMKFLICAVDMKLLTVSHQSCRG